MSIVLPINCGYYQFKSLNNQIFKTRVSEIASENIQTSNDILNYNNQSYLIGYGNKKNIDLDKSQSEVFKLCILNMCARFMAEKFEYFKLIITSPPLTYEKSQEELPRNLIGDYYIKYNGEPKTILIDEVIVFPESFPVFLSNSPANYVNDILLIIDIGGMTTNIIKITGGEFNIQDDYITINKGMFFIDNSISDFLQSNKYLTCNSEDVFYYRKNDFKDICQLTEIYQIYKPLADEIIERMKIKKWNYPNYKIIITGGGGKDMFEYLHQEYFPQAILSNNPIFDNLLGIEQLGRELFL